MSQPLNETPVATFSAATLKRFEQEIVKYPADRKRSAMVPCLSIIQQEQGWISPEYERALAAYLEVPPIAVHEGTSFYNMCNPHPVGKYKISVCTNVPCQLHGGQRALETLQKKLDIADGETSADGLFTVEHCECLGACGDAPVMLVNDRNMCSYMDDAKLEQLVDSLKGAEEVAS